MQKAMKKMPATVKNRTVPLAAAAVVLLGAGAFMQKQIDPTVKEIHKAEAGFDTVSGGLNNEFMLLPLLGFREAAAGLLWVRCDEFFHSGDYDAILPLVRIITLLDPHAENVYVTGAWHLAYNFTDSSERSDKRYIGPAQALLDEGIKNNPNIPDIRFEKGWQNFDKIKNFGEAENAFKSCIAGPHGDGTGVKGTDDYPYAAPLKTLHLLAHTFEKEGKIPEALDEWRQARARTEKMIADDAAAGKPANYGTKQMWYAEVHNFDETMQRYYNRYTAEHHDGINASQPPLPGVLWPTGPGISPQPWDVAFAPKIEIKRPKVFRVSGRFNSAQGARIDVRITDWNYKPRPLVDIRNSFQVSQTDTILMDSVSVKNDSFDREMDMSKDPRMYSFSDQYYRVVLSFNCRATSPHITDRFGWSGEGISDANKSHVIMDDRDTILGTALIDGQGAKGPKWDGKTIPWGEHTQPARLIMVTYKLSREQIMGEKPITDADIVPNSLF